MIRNFPTGDLIDRPGGKLTIAPIPRVGLQFRSLQDSISRPLRPLHPRLMGLGAAFLIADDVGNTVWRVSTDTWRAAATVILSLELLLIAEVYRLEHDLRKS